MISLWEDGQRLIVAVGKLGEVIENVYAVRLEASASRVGYGEGRDVADNIIMFGDRHGTSAKCRCGPPTDA
jgi:hypothetical protein